MGNTHTSFAMTLMLCDVKRFLRNDVSGDGWIGLYCFPCNMMKFGLCVCASVLLILSPVSQFGREVKKCLLRI